MIGGSLIQHSRTSRSLAGLFLSFLPTLQTLVSASQPDTMPNPHDYSDTLPGDRIVCVGSADHTFFYVPSSYVKSHCLTFRDVVEDSIKNGHTLRFDCRARVLRVIFDAMTKNTVNVESAQELLTDIIQVCEEYEMPNIALTIVSEIV